MRISRPPRKISPFRVLVLEQLAQEAASRYGDRCLEGKGVNIRIREVADDLEGVSGASGLLHGGESRGKHCFRCLRFGEEPWVSILGHEKINLHLRLVSDKK